MENLYEYELQDKEAAVDISVELDNLIADVDGEIVEEDDSLGSAMVVTQNQQIDIVKEPKVAKPPFVYKDKDELAAMTSIERKKYQVERNRHELNRAKEALRKAETTISKQERTLDTRRAILHGRLLEKFMREKRFNLDETVVRAELDAYLTKDSERQVFDLPLKK